MTSERWQKIEEILDQVMPRPREDRTAQLDRLCAGDVTLRGEVEDMLVYCDQAQAESFLEKSPVQAAQALVLDAILTETPDTDLDAGASIGAYRIVEQLGRGGMGEVYLAERTEPRMRVALKVVKRGMDTREILQRFRYEREILARLEHPNIAQLHDGGVTDDGRPYFAMEYVEGHPLDVYCDDHQLSVRARLELFKTVCEAVRYAHRNLVVHRDLKPGNILVSEDEAGRPQVKLLDFGIAKLLEDDAALHTIPMTEAGARRMTPNYAAPEQVTGAPTTPATDVYALGVILYKLLTGRRPYHFEDRSVTAIEQAICLKIPEKPSSVVLRPVRSNGTVETTAEHLSRQRAVSPRMLRRQLKGDLDAMILMALRKEPERRYPTAARLLDDIERYLHGHPVVAQKDTVPYRAAKFVRRHKVGVVVGHLALLALGALGATTWQANEAAQQAQRETERADVTLGVISNMLSTVDPQSAQGVTFTARALIAAGLPEIEAVENQPRVQAKMLNEMGRVSLGVRELDLADSLHRQALAVQRRSLGPEDPDVAESLMRLAQVHQAQGKLDEAEATFKDALDVRPDYAPGYGNLGVFYYTQRRYDEAIAQLSRVIELQPDDFQAYNILGAIYFGLDRWDEARRAWEYSLAIRPSYWVYSNLATVYYYREARYADAARMYSKALEENDQDYQVWGHLASAYYWAPAARDSAEIAYRQAIALAEAMLDAVNPTDADVLSRLASYHAMIDEEDKARRRIEQAVAVAPQDNKVMFRVGYAYEQLGDRDEALQWIEKALAQGYPGMYVERDPGLRHLREDPRYRQRMQARDDLP